MAYGNDVVGKSKASPHVWPAVQDHVELAELGCAWNLFALASRHDKKELGRRSSFLGFFAQGNAPTSERAKAWEAY